MCLIHHFKLPDLTVNARKKPTHTVCGMHLTDGVREISADFEAIYTFRSPDVIGVERTSRSLFYMIKLLGKKRLVMKRPTSVSKAQRNCKFTTHCSSSPKKHSKINARNSPVKREQEQCSRYRDQDTGRTT